MERILIKLTEKIGKEATQPENQVKKKILTQLHQDSNYLILD
jgi:hypothetical protein